MSEDPDDELYERIQALYEKLDDAPAEVYDAVTELIGEHSLSHFDEPLAVSILGLLIDSSDVLKRLDGVEQAISLGQEYSEEELSPETSTRLHYSLGNAYSLRRRIEDPEEGPWRWENPDLEQEIYHFRLALDPEGIDGVTTEEVCQIYTNLGNSLSESGRIIEAIRCWNRALATDSSFVRASGQRGIGFYQYAQYHYDQGHQAMLFRVAYEELQTALETDRLYPGMRKRFQATQEVLTELLTEDALAGELEFDEYPLGDSEAEQEYRRWSLDKRLFLNALNDIGPHSIAAQDILHLASVSSENSNKIVSCVGFYNQMKQEYTTARYLLYEGIHADESHFADKDTYLENTLDYPDYSLHAEKVRLAFRMAYSLFDKIASFLQYYYELDYIEEHRQNFGNAWYKSPGKNKLAPEFEDRKNWPLRGLFWLSKDLDYASEMYVEHSLDPGAKELRIIRNDLEHNYLKLHQSFWSGPEGRTDRLQDEFATSFSRDEFEEKALTTIRKARAALIYLSLAIRWEEAQKDDGSSNAPIHLGRWEDDWKR